MQAMLTSLPQLFFDRIIDNTESEYGRVVSCRRSTRVRLSRDKEFNVRLKELKIKLDNVKY